MEVPVPSSSPIGNQSADCVVEAGKYTVQVSAAALGLAASVPKSGSVQSNVLPTSGLSNLMVGVTSTQAGNLSITRYLDLAGTIAAAAASTVALSAATPAVLNVNDSVPFQSYVVSVSNSSGSTAATLSGVIVLQRAP